MKRLPILIAFVVLVLSLTAHAAAAIPQEGVWATPTDAKNGTAITLNTLIYNSTKTAATVTVVFSGAGRVVGTTTLEVPGQTAKTATVKWTQPGSPVTISVEATKAVDAKGKNIPELTGVVGSMTFGGAVEEVPTTTSVFGTSKVGTWLGNAIEWMEPFRIKQAEHFAKLRDEVKARIGIKIGNEVGEKVKDMISPSEVPAATTEGTSYLITKDKADNPFDYVTLVYATSCATLFASKALFYITLALILLIIIRFFVRRFF